MQRRFSSECKLESTLLELDHHNSIAEAARATGVILLDISTPSSLLRYTYRTLFQHYRHGGLEGNKDSIKWKMIHHITVVTPTSRKRHAALFERLELPKIKLSSIKAIKDQFDEWTKSDSKYPNQRGQLFFESVKKVGYCEPSKDEPAELRCPVKINVSQKTGFNTTPTRYEVSHKIIFCD
ncbi:hypothetical protein [Xenorhabdus littoralis]|uniref:hypothetical protein n=1 Tax=Xenorhabdus littoralis TaxID=2582835 RepID=UPI0029E7DE35|nr:hypothetical protein [Xenorhabdus sp. psl]MDX7990341.1 hypothetical protein [Xenorhabdus sp. psl]